MFCHDDILLTAFIPGVFWQEGFLLGVFRHKFSIFMHRSNCLYTLALMCKNVLVPKCLGSKESVSRTFHSLKIAPTMLSIHMAIANNVGHSSGNGTGI